MNIVELIYDLKQDTKIIEGGFIYAHNNRS